MARSKFPTFLVVLASLLALSSCSPDSKSAWTDVVNKCASNEIVGNDWTYLGITNTTGLGSVWRKDTDGLHVRFDPNEKLSQTVISSYVDPGAAASCAGEQSISLDVKADVLLGPSAANLNDSLKASLDSATDTTVSVDQFKVQNIREVDYLNAIQGMGAGYWSDFIKPDRYVLNSVVWVSGLVAKLTFDSKVATQLHATYPTTVPLTADVNAEWQSANVLVIKLSSGSSLVAGRLSSVQAIQGVQPHALLDVAHTKFELVPANLGNVEIKTVAAEFNADGEIHPL